MSDEYDNFRRVAYGDEDGERIVFVPVCPQCRRFVKADESVRGIEGPNADCPRCGRVSMPCEGFY